MPNHAPSRRASAIAIVAGCIIASTVTATSLATTAAVAVAEHDHERVRVEPVPPARCADVLRPVLEEAIAGDVRFQTAETFDDEALAEVIAMYEWYLQRREVVAAEGCDGLARGRLAELRQLTADVEEMRRLEAEAMRLEAKARAVEAAQTTAAEVTKD